jgi:hypothetical protein
MRTERPIGVAGIRAGNRPAGSDANLQLEPVSARSRMLMAFLSVVLPVALSIVLPLFGEGNSARARWIHETLRTQAALERWLGPVLVAAVAGAIWLVIDRLLLRQNLRLDATGLDIKTTMYRRRIAWSDMDLAAAGVIDIDEHPENKPLLKSNGISIPGFRSGWFRSRAFAKLFVATAGGSRLLWLPTKLGYTLLLQPRNPGALLEQLRQRSGAIHGSATTRDARLR